MLNFFSYEDGGKLILRINLGIEHLTHMRLSGNQLSTLLFHIEGRFPKSEKNQNSNETIVDNLEGEEQNLEFNIRTEMDMRLSFTVALLKDLGLLGNELNSLKAFNLLLML